MAFMWMGTPVPEQTRTEPMRVVSRKAKPKDDGLARVIAAPALIVVLVVGMLIGAMGVPEPEPNSAPPTVVGSFQPALSGRLVTGTGWVPNRPNGAEVWWTTVDCPKGVQPPCLDGTVSLNSLPTWAGGAEDS